MSKYIKPVLVLTLIVTVVSTLLMVTYNLTYVDTTGVLTDALKEKCITLSGDGEYRIVTDWKAEGYLIEQPESVEKLIKKDDGTVIFEIKASGYNKNGIDLLVAMNSDGSVNGTSIVSLTETPGLGTKVDTPEFLDNFKGLKDEAVLVKKSPASENEVEAATGATKSSKGVVNAVNTAIKTYREMGAVK